MSRFIQVLNAVLLVALIGLVLLVGWFLWGVHLTVETTLRDFHATVLEAGLTLKNLREASLAWEQSSKEQSANTTRAISHVDAAVVQLSSFISRTDSSINVNVLPALTQMLNDQNVALLTAQSALRADLERANIVLADADAQISDPAIKQSLQNLAEGTKQLADSSVQMTAIATDGRQVADKFRETYLKPRNVALSILKTLIGLGGSMAQMIK
jgi:hypothetical protein